MQLPRSYAARNLFVSFVVVLAFGSVINVIWEIQLEPLSSALQPSASEELVDLARRDEPSAFAKVALATTLRSVAAGGVLVVPPDAALDTMPVEYLADMDVLVEEYDASIPRSAIDQLTDVETVSGTAAIDFDASDVYAFVIAWRAEPVEMLRWFSTEEGDLLLIDETLVEELAG